ncbi:hypothetical protein ACLBX9_16765 [Methylobacterium sp. A49B]
MTQRDMAERVAELRTLADRIRMPDHRFTAEHFMIARDELRTALYRFDRDMCGQRRERPPAPSAIARHQDRRRAAVLAKRP